MWTCSIFEELLDVLHQYLKIGPNIHITIWFSLQGAVEPHKYQVTTKLQTVGLFSKTFLSQHVFETDILNEIKSHIKWYVKRCKCKGLGLNACAEGMVGQIHHAHSSCERNTALCWQHKTSSSWSQQLKHTQWKAFGRTICMHHIVSYLFCLIALVPKPCSSRG